MRMAWFDLEILDFFAELELNNNRDWFRVNKDRYEKIVKEPMEAFAADVISRMRQLDPAIEKSPKEAVFRIYRDTRFGKDKTPYKTNAGLSITPGGKRHFEKPGVFFHVDARIMGIASGYYTLESPQINSIRQYIAIHPEQFDQLLADQMFVATFGAVKGEQNKVLPPELKSAAAHQPLLYNKQFYYWAEFSGAEIVRDDLSDLVIHTYQAAVPMNEFLSTAMG